MTALNQHDYAGMLLLRGQAGDRDKSLGLLDEAIATAQEIGMKGLLAKARKQLE